MNLQKVVIMRWAVLTVTICLAFPCVARVYQWTDPETGTAYMSGTPPAWYRTREGGPRVLVYDEGELVDDTEWQASREREKSLRQKALKELEERKLAEEQRRQEEAAKAAQKGVQEEVDVTEEEPDVAKLRDLVRFYLLTEKGAAKVKSEVP